MICFLLFDLVSETVNCQNLQAPEKNKTLMLADGLIPGFDCFGTDLTLTLLSSCGNSRVSIASLAPSLCCHGRNCHYHRC